MKTITVSAEALIEVLQSLVGPGHLIRELQATRGLSFGDKNPIDILIEEFNAGGLKDCDECGGLGKCDDLEPGDIRGNEWACPKCGGRGKMLNEA